MRSLANCFMADIGAKKTTCAASGGNICKKAVAAGDTVVAADVARTELSDTVEAVVGRVVVVVAAEMVGKSAAADSAGGKKEEVGCVFFLSSVVVVQCDANVRHGLEFVRSKRRIIIFEE